jgi:dihydropyrimidine dehydrogenase (NAD+) subunit PreA
MPDLRINLAGIRSPNPFWLASGPPTNTADQVLRAFDAGWGGAVWKTLGRGIVNVSSRLASLDHAGQRLAGLGNIELISDRTVEENVRDIAEVKHHYPDRPVIASLMFGPRDEWEEVVRLCEEAGCDGLELNFGCPHGMCERGMGSAVGQEPEIVETLAGWVMEVARVPVLVKLTPNVTDIREPARAAVRAGVDGLALINTVQCIPGVDLDRFVPLPRVARASSHGGLSGPAVKPIALRMVAELARDPETPVPLSGIGGIASWRDAAEFLALGATSVQICTAVMHRGFGIIHEFEEGLAEYLSRKGMASVMELVGRAVPAFRDWGDLDLNYRIVAEIDEHLCTGCGQCHIACRDGGHHAIHLPGTPPAPGHVAPMAETAARKAHEAPRDEPYRVPWVDETSCVGCNLCSLVCPVDGCVRMVERRRRSEAESWKERVAREDTVREGNPKRFDR